MSDTITLAGVVATTPRHLVTSSGLAITSFRLACGQRRFDREKNAWVDAETNWYTVSAFRHLAHNVVRSVRKGEHVLVAGRLRVRDWENSGRNGTSVEVEADAIGHDLTWCTTTFVRSVPAAAQAREQVEEQEDAGQPATLEVVELTRADTVRTGELAAQASAEPSAGVPTDTRAAAT